MHFVFSHLGSYKLLDLASQDDSSFTIVRDAVLAVVFVGELFEHVLLLLNRIDVFHLVQLDQLLLALQLLLLLASHEEQRLHLLDTAIVVL